MGDGCNAHCTGSLLDKYQAINEFLVYCMSSTLSSLSRISLTLIVHIILYNIRLCNVILSMLLDIAVFRRQSDLESLHIVANGCPDHAYFQHAPLQTTFSISGDSSCASSDDWSSDGDCSSNATAATATATAAAASVGDGGNPFHSNPNVPRYLEYRLAVPVAPVLASTVQWPEATASQPIGIAVNGVLIFSEHSGVSNFTRKVDNCGGHADTSHRYHYHSPPVCLLLAMSATVPETGAAYLQELAAEDQTSHWPAQGTPSDVLGVALDGFPIYVSDFTTYAMYVC